MPHTGTYPTERTINGLAEDLRQVAAILTGYARELPNGAYMSLSINYSNLAMDTEKVRAVKLLAGALLGKSLEHDPNMIGDFGVRPSGLALHILAKLDGAQRGREAALEAEVARLRAERDVAVAEVEAYRAAEHRPKDGA